jgi:hypothetical protein
VTTEKNSKIKFVFIISIFILYDFFNERTFKVIKELVKLWPECKMVSGRPRHSQSQGSVERANREVRAKLACWKAENNSTQWSKGLRVVQWQINSGFHSGIFYIFYLR